MFSLLLINHVYLQTHWAHIDIAGTAWNYKSGTATGYGVRTLVEFLVTPLPEK